MTTMGIYILISMISALLLFIIIGVLSGYMIGDEDSDNHQSDDTFY